MAAITPGFLVAVITWPRAATVYTMVAGVFTATMVRRCRRGKVTVPYTITYADRSEQLFEFDGGDTLTDVAAVLKALRTDGYRVVMVLNETDPADPRKAAAEVGIANTSL